MPITSAVYQPRGVQTTPRLSDFKYALPEKLIAQEPLAKTLGLTQGRLSQIEHSKGGSMSLEAFILYARTIGAEVVLQPTGEEEN